MGVVAPGEKNTRSKAFNWCVQFIYNLDKIQTVLSATQEVVVLVYKRISA